MRCVITGVAGFVGSSLADQLLKLGHEVVGVDCFIDYYPKELKLRNLEQARGSERFSLVEKNLLELDLVKLLEGAQWVFHQAAQAGVRASWGKHFETYTTNNVLATQCLLEAAKNDAVARSLKRLVFASSSSVYGLAEAFPTSESTLPRPISPYGVTKLAAEQLMVLYAREFGVPTISLRYFTVYGPRQRPDMAFNRFLRAVLEEREIEVFGDGEQTRDFTFISDAVRANLLAAESDNDGLVCNIGGGSRVTVNQVLEKIRYISGRKLDVRYVPRQKGDPKHTAADTTLARTLLGYRPEVDLTTGLTAELDWLQQSLGG